jgi:uncharacterized protein (DUF1697 family)
MGGLYLDWTPRDSRRKWAYPARVPLYVALLRAINLAGKNKVGMADLREMCGGLGYEEARTLLQSGNLVIRANAGASGKLERELHEETKKKLGVETDYFVRTEAEWDAVLTRNPYPTHAKRDPGHLLVVFLKDAPDKKQAAALDEAITGRETARVIGRHAYLYYPDGVGTSKLTNAKIEKSLGTRGTARNWNTVMKLAAMLGLLLGAAISSGGCGKSQDRVPLEPEERFTWCAQPIAFSPPPAPWYREAEVSGGLLGVRFVLRGGLGECITVAAYSHLIDPASTDSVSLADVLPQIRLRPETKQEPERWRLGYERDTTIAGYPAFASDDTLITPDRPMLYHQVYWVVNRCAFQAVYQGTKPNLVPFERLLHSIAFPAPTDSVVAASGSEEPR